MLKETITAEYNAVRQRLLDGWTVTIKGDPVRLYDDTYLEYRGLKAREEGSWKLIADEEAVCTKAGPIRGQVQTWDRHTRCITVQMEGEGDLPESIFEAKTVEITVVDK